MAVYDDGSMCTVDAAHNPRPPGGAPSHSMRLFTCGRTPSLPPLLSPSLPPSLQLSPPHFLGFRRILSPSIASSPNSIAFRALHCFSRIGPEHRIGGRHISQLSSWEIRARPRKSSTPLKASSGEYEAPTPDSVNIFMFHCGYAMICCTLFESLVLCLNVIL